MREAGTMYAKHRASVAGRYQLEHQGRTTYRPTEVVLITLSKMPSSHAHMVSLRLHTQRHAMRKPQECINCPQTSGTLTSCTPVLMISSSFHLGGLTEGVCPLAIIF